MLIYFNTEGINYYFLFPFLGFFFLVGASFIARQSAFGKYSYIQNLIISLSEMLAVIPYSIAKKIDNEINPNNSNRRNKIEKNKQNVNDKHEYNDKDKKFGQLQLNHIILLGFVDFLHYFFMFYGHELYGNNYHMYFWSLYIAFIFLFKKIFMNNMIYRHQILSLVIIIIFDIFYTILVLIDNQIKYKPLRIIFLVMSNFCFSFEIVFVRKMREKSFTSTFRICFLIGVTTFIYNIILLILTILISYRIKKIEQHKKYILNYFHNIKDVFTEIMSILLFMLFAGASNIFKFITVVNLSPNHTLITKILLALYYTILTKITLGNINLGTFIFAVCYHLICFLALLILLEIIQLNFCGMENSKLRIGIRSDVDKYFENLAFGALSANPNGSVMSIQNDNNNCSNLLGRSEDKSTDRDRRVSDTYSDIDYTFD